MPPRRAHAPVQRVVLVTGAGRGIGFAVADAFAHAGWRVLATGRDEATLGRLAARGWTPIPLDVADAGSCTEAAEAALHAGPPFVLVNNAGYAELGPIETLDRAALRRQFETNLFGPLDLARRLAPAMRAALGGRIVQMSSVSGRVRLPWAGAYTASKHALEAATDSLRVELAPWRIGVTLIEPGLVRGDFTVDASTGIAPRVAGTPYASAWPSVSPLVHRFGRVGVTPERVARAVLRAATARRAPRRVVVGASARFTLTAMTLTPQWFQDLVARRLLRPRT